MIRYQLFKIYVPQERKNHTTKSGYLWVVNFLLYMSLLWNNKVIIAFIKENNKI